MASQLLGHFVCTQHLLTQRCQRPFTPIKQIKCSFNQSKAGYRQVGEPNSSRRGVVSGVAVVTLLAAWPASALGFKKELKKRGARSIDEYREGADGLKTLDLADGSGSAVKQGDLVTVHFDSIYKGIDVASSRAARLLGGNRTISEPLTFTAGKIVRVSQGAAGETAGGLFSGQSGPKPPPALSKAVIGMKPGGKRSVLVPPELGYGHEGLLEIPPDSSFELRIEVLSVGGSQ